ncbi:MAG: ABC transporter substrate-binding protein [Solirubrobacterales bacterium]
MTLVTALLASALLAVGCGSSDSDSDSSSSGDGVETLTLQYNWSIDEGLIGEVVATEKGYFEDEGLKVEFEPGGPTNDGIAPVAQGKAEIGVAAESPQIMLAQSQQIPVQAFGAGLQNHPYAFFSMPDTPLASPEDLKGKTVGVPPPARSMLDTYLEVNGMSEDDLAGVKAVSFDPGPLMQGQVDVWGSWLTDTDQLALLPEGYNSLPYAESVPLYSAVYFSNPDYISDNADQLEGFITASAKGWEYTRENPEEAAQMFIDAYPNAEGKTTAKNLAKSLDILFPFMFTATSEENGFATMNQDNWQTQLDLWEDTGQFDKGDVPTVDDVMTTSILDATSDDR